MCYSRTCNYENEMGNCTVPCTFEFEQKLGVSSCLVGGFKGIPDEHRLSPEKQKSLEVKAEELNLV